ncbi:MAG: FtsX-like permease family protein [Saprospiraceae bacterium]|nr:FtsX-like permease family protein [Saprospiraceae bacterium]
MSLIHFISRRLRSTEGDSFTRTIIYFAIGTIALCVTVILLAHALILGFKTEIKAKVFGFWGHIQITSFNLNNTFESPPILENQTFYPALDSVGQIDYEDELESGQVVKRTTYGGIRHIQAYALKPGILTRKDNLEGIILKGVGTDFDWDFLEEYMLEGEPIRLTDTVPSRDIWVSATTASRLRLKLHDDLIVYFIQENRQVERRFQVAGIYKTGLEEYDKKFALVDIRQIRAVNDWPVNAVTGFEVFVDDLRDLDPFTAHIYYDWLPDDLYIESIRQKFPAIFDWVDLQDINEQVLIILMLIVAMINLITVLLILILERFTMVGILKALGAHDQMIRSIFIRMTLRILLWGMGIGNVMALIIGSVQARYGWMKLDESEYYLSVVPIRWDPWFFLLLNGMFLIVAFLTLWIPSMYIKRIQPVKAIRFK